MFKKLSRLSIRVALPLVSIFILPKLLGVEIYANFILQFYFFSSAIGLLTSPLEHVLIRLSASGKRYALHFSQLVPAYVFISGAICGLSFFVYEIFGAKSGYRSPLFFAALSAMLFQLSYFLKFFRKDFYYLYSEAAGYFIVILFGAVISSFGKFTLEEFAQLNAACYFAICFFRMAQLYAAKAVNKIRMKRLIPVIFVSYKSTSIATILGAFIKRADSFYMPYLAGTAESVVIYRFVRNIISVLSMFGTINAQDAWMGGDMNAKSRAGVLCVFVSSAMLALTAIAVKIYCMWVGAVYAVSAVDVICVSAAIFSASYMFVYAIEISNVFRKARYDVIFSGSLIAFLVFLVLNISAYITEIKTLNYLLVVVYVPQLANAIFIRNKMKRSQ